MKHAYKILFEITKHGAEARKWNINIKIYLKWKGWELDSCLWNVGLRARDFMALDASGTVQGRVAAPVKTYWNVGLYKRLDIYWTAEILSASWQFYTYSVYLSKYNVK
jgi:hypothetical protein